MENNIALKIHDEMRAHLGQNQSSWISEEEFVDLPGVVSAIRSDEPESLPVQTRELTKKYISDRNPLILAVVPCMEYIFNNSIVWLIQECGAVERTLVYWQKSI